MTVSRPHCSCPRFEMRTALSKNGEKWNWAVEETQTGTAGKGGHNEDDGPVRKSRDPVRVVIHSVIITVMYGSLVAYQL